MAMEAMFSCAERGFSGIALPYVYLSMLKEYAINDIAISACIDYPGGFAPQQIRNHSAVKALKGGANTIDLMCNSISIVNENYDYLERDIESHMNICFEYDATLRAMVEYRAFDNSKKFMEICKVFKKTGLEYIFLSTGKMVDDFLDHAIYAVQATEEFGLKVIFNAPVMSEEQYKKVEDWGIFGVRFSNIKNVERIFGVL